MRWNMTFHQKLPFSWARSIQSKTFQTIISKYILISSSHLNLGLSGALFPRSPHQNTVCPTLRPLHPCHIPRPAHSSSFHPPNNIWRGLQYAVPSYLISLKPSCLPQNLVIEDARTIGLPFMWQTKFYTHIKQQETSPVVMKAFYFS